MSLMMRRAFIILVLVGFVYCEETNGNTTLEKKSSSSVTSPSVGSSTSSVVIENKVQNVSIGYKNNHTTHPSSVVNPAKPSNNTDSIAKASISKDVKPSTTKSGLVANITAHANHNSTITRIKHINSNTREIDYLPPVNPTHFLPTIVPDSAPSANKNIIKYKAPIYHKPNLKTYKPNNASNQVDVEKMEVKEMRLVTDKKENNKFRFYVVDDGNNTDPVSKFPNGNQAHYSPKNQWSNRPSIKESKRQVKGANLKAFSMQSLETSFKPAIPRFNQSHISNLKPSYQNVSTTPNFLTHHKKFNASSHGLGAKKEYFQSGNRDFSCLRCVGNKGGKQYKIPAYPTKKDPPLSNGHRAVKLQGPDGDSILGSSKQNFVVVKPEVSRPFTNTTARFRGHKHGFINQKNTRTQFLSQDALGSYSTTSNTDYIRQQPENNGFQQQKVTHPPSDLYNLDEPELSSSIASNRHVKYERKEIHIPYPITIEKKVPYPIHIKVERPVPVHIDKPYPVHVEKKVPVPVKVHVPQPYPVEKEVPYPVKVPVEVPRAVQVSKPVPYMVENPVPVQIIKEVRVPIKVPVDVPVPYKVPIQVEKRVPYFVEKKVPFEVPVPVEKPHFVEVKETFEVPIEKPYPVTVEKKIPVPVQIVEYIKVPVPVKVSHEHLNGFQHRKSDIPEGAMKQGQTGETSNSNMEIIRSVEIPVRQNARGDSEISEIPVDRRIDHMTPTDGQHDVFQLQRMLSVEFPHESFSDHSTRNEYQNPFMSQL